MIKNCKCLFFIFLILSSFCLCAQTYNWNGSVAIQDLQTDTIPLTVSGMPTVIDTNYGLSHVCLDIIHTYKSDLIISLISPSGSSVSLIQGIGGSGDNFTGTCLGMDGTSFSNTTAPYTGIFVPTGDISSFNNGQNPNGSWRLIVRDAANSDTGFVTHFRLEFANNPPRNGNPLVPVSNATFTCAGCVCPGGAAACDLLPDVTSSAKEIQLNHVEEPGSLNISNATPNIGFGPIEIYGIDSCFCDGQPVPCNTICPNEEEIKHVIKQRIYQKRSGTDTLGYYDRFAGAMTYHREHGHLHVDDWASYTLRTATVNPDATTWPIVGTGVKQSFCLVNLGNCTNNPGECTDINGNPLTTFANANLGFRTGCGLTQGIYVGNYDVYSLSLNEPINLQNVCDGNYYVVSITDPRNNFIESNETNNWVAVPITLTKQNLTPVISVSGPTSLCSGDSVILTANNAANVLWSNGSTEKNIVVRSPGTYTVTNTCGNSVSAPIVVTGIGNNQVQVNISVSSGSNPGCTSDPLTFNASVQYGGTTPVYQWKVNGVNAGTNSSSFTLPSHINGQMVSCEVTSSVQCISNPNGISNAIRVEVIADQQPTVDIFQTIGNNPLCAGDSVQFKAIVNHGNPLLYQWKKNGLNVGPNLSTFSSNAVGPGDVISCVVNAFESCPVNFQIGNSSSTNTTTNNVGTAYPTYYGNGRQQYLIRASELIALGLSAGNLRSLAFSVAGTIGNPDTLKSYTIKLAHTTSDTLGAAFLTPSFTTVFGPVDYKPMLSSINTHAFTLPFFWNGTSNVLVDICFTNGVYGYAAYQSYNSQTSFRSSAVFQQDYPAGMVACTQPTANFAVTVRPNMYFGKDTPIVVQSNPIVMQSYSDDYPSIAINASSGTDTICANNKVIFTAIVSNQGVTGQYIWMKNDIQLTHVQGETFSDSSFSPNDKIQCLVNGTLHCSVPYSSSSNLLFMKIADSVYTFNGNGSWSISSNWLNGKKPPVSLPSCAQIIIDPNGTGQCILEGMQTIMPGARLTVRKNKRFKVRGNLKIER